MDKNEFTLEVEQCNWEADLPVTRMSGQSAHNESMVNCLSVY